MHNSLPNQVSEKTVNAMGYLEPIVKKMYINLKNTKERVDADKEELSDLKKEFSKVFNELVKKSKIHNILIPNIGYVHNQKIAEDTSVNTMITIYNNLEAFYLSTSGKAASFVVQEKKQAIVDIFEEEQESIAHSAEKKKTGLWEMISEAVCIPNISEKNYMDIIKKFNGKHYTIEQLIKITEDLRNIKKKYGYSLDEKGREFVVEVSKHIKEFLEISQEKIKEESKKRSKEKTETIFLDNISCINDFVLWVETFKENQLFTAYSTVEELKTDTKMYGWFLGFRKMLFEKYTKDVYEKYEFLFTNDQTIDGFYYSNILSDLKNIGSCFGPNINDIQLFLGIKNHFILGDLYEFLSKQLNDSTISIVDPLLIDEINAYKNKKPINIEYM